MNQTVSSKGTPLPCDQKLVEGPHEFRLGVDAPAWASLGAVTEVRVQLKPREAVDRVLDLGRPIVSLPVRLVVPGSLVLPSEQNIEASPFEPTEVVFQLMPYVTGRLPECRVEALYGTRIESLAFPMRAHGHRWPWIWLTLTLVVPLLLHWPVMYADWIAEGGVARSAESWLPGLGGREAMASQLQSSANSLVRIARDYHLSFFALIGLLIVGLTELLDRRAKRLELWGAAFPVGTVTKVGAPPNYLMPVSSPELGTISSAWGR